MEIRQLYYVLETAKQKNFTKAAEALFTSQPNVSKQISLLEEELGTKLFFRSHHSVILTRDGERFCVHAQKIINDFDALMKDFNGDTSDETVRLNVAVFPFFDRLPMSASLREFFTGNEKINGSIRSVDNYEAYRALDSGEVHFAIIKLRPEDMLPQFRYRLLYEEDLVVIINKSHELAGKEICTEAELAEYGFSPGKGFMSLYSGNSVHSMISSADFLMHMISETGGFTFITESAGATVSHPDMKLIPIAPPIPYNTYLVYPMDMAYRGVYREFIDYAESTMKR